LVAAFARPDLIDFAAFVDNARAWLDGQPYPDESRDPNAPHVILLFLPFAGLSRTAGLTIWTLVSYACLAWTIRMVLRELDLRPSRPLAVTALALLLAAPPMLDVVVNGNMIWPLMAVFTLTWRWARHGRDHAAAAGLGLLITAKPFLGVLLLLYVVRRAWAPTAIAVATAAGTLVIAVWVTGLDAWIAWYHALQRISWYDVRFNASVLGVLARVGRQDVVLWGVASVLVAGLTAWMLRRPRPRVDLDWAVVLLASLLMAPLGWRYYLCFGIGPLIAVWMENAGPTGPAYGRTLALLALAWSPSLALPGAAPILQATAGSLPFWILAIGWIALATSRARSSPSGRR